MEAECVRERPSGLWHVVLGDGNADFQPILCGRTTGIGIDLPGPSRWCAPTCPECRAMSERTRAPFIGAAGKQAP
jgi:hypothetical protein